MMVYAVYRNRRIFGEDNKLYYNFVQDNWLPSTEVLDHLTSDLPKAEKITKGHNGRLLTMEMTIEVL